MTALPDSWSSILGAPRVLPTPAPIPHAWLAPMESTPPQANYTRCFQCLNKHRSWEVARGIRADAEALARLVPPAFGGSTQRVALVDSGVAFPGASIWHVTMPNGRLKLVGEVHFRNATNMFSTVKESVVQQCARCNVWTHTEHCIDSGYWAGARPRAHSVVHPTYVMRALFSL